jgi:glycosidase
LKGENTLQQYLKELKRQEEIYPENYIKLRNLENHDFGRFAPMVESNIDKINNWTSLMFFMKGSTMVYAGQENLDTNRPDLFEIDRVNWDKGDITDLITKLAKITNHDAFADGKYNIRITDLDIYVGQYELNNERFIGLFNVGLEEGNFNIDIPDGTYINIIDDSEIVVKNGNMELTNKPVIINTKA